MQSLFYDSAAIFILFPTKSSAVAERPHDALCQWKSRCHSRSIKVVRNYTVE